MQMLLSVLMKVQGRNQGGLVSDCSISIFIVAVAVLVISELPTGLSWIQRQSRFMRCPKKKSPPAKASGPGGSSCCNSTLRFSSLVRLAKAVNYLILLMKVD